MITAQLRNIGRSAQSRDQTLREGLEERERILMAWVGAATGAIQRMQATQINDTWALVNMANRLDALQESMVDITNPIANNVRRITEQDLPNVLERLAAIDDDTGTIREWIEANKENLPTSPLTIAPRTRHQSAAFSSHIIQGSTPYVRLMADSCTSITSPLYCLTHSLPTLLFSLLSPLFYCSLSPI